MLICTRTFQSRAQSVAVTEPPKPKPEPPKPKPVAELVAEHAAQWSEVIFSVLTDTVTQVLPERLQQAQVDLKRNLFWCR